VVKELCYKPEGQGFETGWGEWIFSIHLILPAILGPGVYSASDRNEYQKQKNNVSWGIECGRCIRLRILPPPVSKLSRQYGILNISQPVNRDSFTWYIYIHTHTLACMRAGCLKKQLYNGIPNVTVWQVLWKRLHLKAYKLFIVELPSKMCIS
jgi:hypothetical protein